MTRLPVLSGRDAVKAFARIAYDVDHQAGSHVILRHRSPPFRRLSVPNHAELAKGTLRALIRDAGLTVEEFTTHDSVLSSSSSGYVIHTVEAAFWAIETFEDALRKAVNLDGEPDTVGAVTGRFAGALCGASSTPPRCGWPPWTVPGQGSDLAPRTRAGGAGGEVRALALQAARCLGGLPTGARLSRSLNG